MVEKMLEVSSEKINKKITDIVNDLIFAGTMEGENENERELIQHQTSMLLTKLEVICEIFELNYKNIVVKAGLLLLIEEKECGK